MDGKKKERMNERKKERKKRKRKKQRKKEWGKTKEMSLLDMLCNLSSHFLVGKNWKDEKRHV